MGKKNYGKSVKTRLLNLMNETGYKYLYLLARYFNERLLYRVSVSQYKDNFLLKGGSLLYAMDGLNARPTIDVDFMAERISRNREFLTKVFQEILGIVDVYKRQAAFPSAGAFPAFFKRAKTSTPTDCKARSSVPCKPAASSWANSTGREVISNTKGML